MNFAALNNDLLVFAQLSLAAMVGEVPLRPLNLGMAQSLKRKASMEEPPKRQTVAIAQAQASDSHSDLPVERRNIDPELLDFIPEEYFDAQHNFWCSCIGCRLLRPSY